MKTKTVFAALTVIFAGMFVYAFIMAAHTGSATRVLGQEQSGWMMMCFVCAALMLIGIEGGWGKMLLQLGCLCLALVFAIHFFGGSDALRALAGFVERMVHKLFQG